MPAPLHHAVRLAVILALVVSSARPVLAQSSSARSIYQAALARDREARDALAAPDTGSRATLRVVRSAISAYRRVVRSFPRSGYCDDALWRAAGLATDAFARFGEARDRVTARELLTQLVRGYPSSQMVALARRALDDPGTTGTPTTLTIRAIIPTAVPDRVDVSIETAGRGAMSFIEARLEAPPRYYVDVRGPRLDPAMRNRTWAVDSSLVTHVRVGQRSASVTRVVLDTPDPASCRARQLTDPPRLEIECTAAPLPAAPRGTMWATPPAPPAATAIIAAPPAPGPPVPAPVESVSAPAPPESPLWSLPIDPATVMGLPAFGLPEAAAPAVPLPMGRTQTPVGSAYAAFVPRTPLVQQPALQIAVASQFTTGDETRTGGQSGVVPDLGVQLFEPGLAIGNLYADVNITRRDNGAAVGRGVVRLDGLRLGGLVWSLDAGDTWNAPVVQDFGFTNLFAPPVTFQGVSASGSSPRTFMLVSAGRVTAQRNIFGTDTEPIGQRIYQGLFSHRVSDRVDVFGHANHIDSRAMTLYAPLTEWSTDAGGGVRYRPFATVEVVADAGLSQFCRNGAAGAEQTPSGLIGALWSFTRGWVQINAQRYPIGRFAVYNYPYVDRQGVFASGELDVGSRARLFGGAEYAITNLDPGASADATVGVSPGNGARAYGGVRLSLFDTSMVTLRVDGGGRRIEPSHFGPTFDSNTGVVAMDWHTRFSRGNAFARYERRTNTDPASESSSFTQDDLLAQVYVGFAGGRQIFGTLLTSRRSDLSGDGETQWQIGGGAQAALGRVYARAEGTAGRTLNWITQLETSRQALSLGLSTQIAGATFVSLDLYADHTPVLAGSGSPWVTRTMLRLTRMFPFGPSRLSQPGGQTIRTSGPSGRISGTVFVDWNDNGEPDPDEEAVSGVGITIPGVASVLSGADGRFVASGVPTGEQRVALQLDSVPADYDPPPDAERLVTVVRNQSASVAFGMLPMGSFGGMVYQDVDGDGQLGPADTPIDGAVLVMDDGSRTEITREGRFTFDPVRMGTHAVSILTESLPDGSQIFGPRTIEVVLARGQDAETVVFLVKVEKRPEIRKVFPPKKK